MHKKDSTTAANVNYISLGMERLKELSAPVVSSINSLNPSQRRMALIAVGVLLFWPFFILALNLPWMLAACCALYGLYFGGAKLCSDANEAVKEHLDVDVGAKGRLVQEKFEKSQFPGKETLVYSFLRFQELVLVAYKSLLLASMTVLDILVTFLLNTARSAKKMAKNNSN